MIPFQHITIRAHPHVHHKKERNLLFHENYRILSGEAHVAPRFLELFTLSHNCDTRQNSCSVKLLSLVFLPAAWVDTEHTFRPSGPKEPDAGG
jgi:hypothetical protein